MFWSAYMAGHLQDTTDAEVDNMHHFIGFCVSQTDSLTTKLIEISNQC